MKFFEGRKFVVDLTKTQSKSSVLFWKGHFSDVVFKLAFQSLTAYRFYMLNALANLYSCGRVWLCAKIYSIANFGFDSKTLPRRSDWWDVMDPPQHLKHRWFWKVKCLFINNIAWDWISHPSVEKRGSREAWGWQKKITEGGGCVRSQGVKERKYMIMGHTRDYLLYQSGRGNESEKIKIGG